MSAPRSVTEIDFPVDLQLHPSPRDWRDQFIYFLLVDRFDDNDLAVPAYRENGVRDQLFQSSEWHYE